MAFSSALSNFFRSIWRICSRNLSSSARCFSLIGLCFFQCFFVPRRYFTRRRTSSASYRTL